MKVYIVLSVEVPEGLDPVDHGIDVANQIVTAFQDNEDGIVLAIDEVATKS